MNAHDRTALRRRTKRRPPSRRCRSWRRGFWKRSRHGRGDHRRGGAHPRARSGLTARTLRLRELRLLRIPAQRSVRSSWRCCLGARHPDLILTASVGPDAGPGDQALTKLGIIRWRAAWPPAPGGADPLPPPRRSVTRPGLLHDIGAFFLRQQEPGRFERRKRSRRRRGNRWRSRSGKPLRLRPFGGGWMAGRALGATGEIVEEIACHHRPWRPNRAPELTASSTSPTPSRIVRDTPGRLQRRPDPPRRPPGGDRADPSAGALLEGLIETVVRETERESQLFAEFRRPSRRRRMPFALRI